MSNSTNNTENSLVETSTNDSSLSESSSDIIPSTTESDLPDTIECTDENFYSNACNKFLLKHELLERHSLSDDDSHEFLYPNLNDAQFNIKIATKREFHDTKYEGPDFSKSIKEQADLLANADFELQPHQAFVKNFMSFQTPYSSLLLYHGLGSGKTCSAIGVCEEMRDYMKQMGIQKRIIIVASENVQDNFRLQLFDERKLKEVNGIWSMRGCVGNKLLKEINPMNIPMSREKIVSQIKNVINTYYIFLGYVQFANYIIKTMNYEEEVRKRKDKEKPVRGKSKINELKDVKVELNNRIIRRLRNEFNNRLIVIDEVHNIRKTDDNENKKVAVNLEFLVKAAQNMRFLLLSATPMYNNYKEIIWLLNLMNTNDRRGRIEARDIFDKTGNFKKDGEELLIRKATGYISFVRGENPYTFPYRVYPNEFAPDHTFPEIEYPSHQMNLRKIGHEDKKRILSLYLTTIGNCQTCGKCQYCCYRYIIHHLRNKKFSITTNKGVIRDMPSFQEMESFGYTMLQTPLESLIISYPVPGLKEILDTIPDDNLSSDVADKFESSNSSLKDEEEEEDDEITPIESGENSPLAVKSVSSERKPAEEEEDEDYDVNDNPDYGNMDTALVDENDSIVVSKTMTPTPISKTMTPTPISKTMTPTPISKTMTPTTNITQHTTDNRIKSTINERSGPLEILPRSHQGQNTMGGNKGEGTTFSIDPHQLTGKIGLERMMNFVDSKSPLVKGDYEYKPDIVRQYGRIFSREQIGYYSSKIKTILTKIYNDTEDKVSDGIILIYSQYIDSGLIPVALALEEMGFTRYGQSGTKPLFKSRPTAVVDARTMKPPANSKDFKPARYSMITGDIRLSPDNDFEVKGLTGEDNILGHKIKVVLISKAGSEGIDLKYIRQVHILDPWYNMNRPEQTIGRAVRNFSHKDLPFEQRNVEIYMHATILDKNVEESADMYVYRVAEFKAVQIGKVTRVLKETAVDCIINHDQTQFTREIMSANLKQPITQQLSSGKILTDFKVGDAPFSPACDYMASCNYNCRPDASIKESELNDDTYDQHFIMMNSEKILQRIRMLFKDAFFYKKDKLLRAIRTPKEYPYVQIYSALTQLIEDENEFLIDRYGRNGRLINIGDYYMFQPIELKDNHVSIYERSVPLDYKHTTVKFEIKKEVAKPPTITKPPTLDTNIEPQNTVQIHTEGIQVIDTMRNHYNTTLEYLENTKVARGDDDWFKHCGIVIQKMKKDYPESNQYMLPFLVAHMIELLLFREKHQLMNYVYSLENIQQESLEKYVKQYFEENIISTNKHMVFIAYELNKRHILMLNNSNEWVIATPEDEIEIAKEPETKAYLFFDVAQYNKIIGFMGYEKGNKDLAFKTKNMESKRDTGARCDQATKNKNLAKLNDILGEEKYTTENTKAIKEAGIVVQEAMGNVELCVLEEFILRYYHAIREKGLKWFITPELAIWHKIYKIFV